MCDHSPKVEDLLVTGHNNVFLRGVTQLLPTKIRFGPSIHTTLDRPQRPPPTASVVCACTPATSLPFPRSSITCTANAAKCLCAAAMAAAAEQSPPCGRHSTCSCTSFTCRSSSRAIASVRPPQHLQLHLLHLSQQQPSNRLISGGSDGCGGQRQRAAAPPLKQQVTTCRYAG